MSYLATECGRRIFFADYAAEQAEEGVVLLVHGWGVNSECWDPILPALKANGLRIITFDQRCCGSSDKTFHDVSIGAIAGDIVALVEHLGLTQVILNGWSLGGAVAVDAASKLGGRCAGLVLTGGATPIYVEKPDFPHGGSADDVAASVQAYETDRVDFLYGLSRIICSKKVGVHIENWFHQMFLTASPFAGRTLGELATSDQRKMLIGIKIPMLSIFGDSDQFVAPAICRWVGDNHPNARNVEFAGVGHAPFIEEREAYILSFMDFVKELR